jgi:hypothetical protein
MRSPAPLVTISHYSIPAGMLGRGTHTLSTACRRRRPASAPLPLTTAPEARHWASQTLFEEGGEMARSKVFISYSHRDDRWRQRLTPHLGVLARQGLIDVWDDRKIGAGAEWREEIHQHMLSARVAVLLVSAWFLDSSFVLEKEIPVLFQRHEQDGMRIYPLLIRACPYKEVPWLEKMQLRPRDAKPLASFRGSKVDEVLAEVASEIADIVRQSLAVH